MVESIKLYEGAYLSTDKKTAVSGLEELYSYLMTKFLEDYKAGTNLTQLYKDITSFLKAEHESDSSKAKSFEDYASLKYDLISDAFQMKYPTIGVSYGYASVRSDAVIIVSEKNTYPYEAEDRTYILKVSDNEFQNIRYFFFSKVFIPETIHLNSFSATVTWGYQSLSNYKGDSIGFVKFVSPKNLEGYKRKANALIVLARYLQKVLPDSHQTKEYSYLNYFLFRGNKKDYLKSNFDIECFRRGDYDPNDATTKYYLQILKGLGYGYTSDSARIGSLSTKEALGSNYSGYVKLCEQAGITPSERVEFRTRKVNFVKGEVVESDEYIW